MCKTNALIVRNGGDLQAIIFAVFRLSSMLPFEKHFTLLAIFAALFFSPINAQQITGTWQGTINKKKVDDPFLKPDVSMLLHNKFLLVQKGKKNYYLLQVE